MTATTTITAAPATHLMRALRRREISSRELLEQYLARIEERNPALNAVVTLDVEGARATAAAADQATARGHDLGALHGLPITIKDSLETTGMRTTSGAPDLAGYVPARDADAVARLRAAGAVIFGKTNLPTFAMDWQTYNPVFGTTNNPWDLARTPGGSSGGAAAAIAAALTGLELGSDIRGSLRQPAHNTGIFTLKPSFGLVPVRGHIPGPPGTLSSPDLAVVGPLARSADDLDLALDVLAGPDAAMATAWRLRLPAPRGRSLSDYRIAVWLDDAAAPVDSTVLRVLASAVQELRHAGAHINDDARPVDLAESNATFDKLFQAAVSPGAADWNHTNERREQLRAQWQAFFRSFDVILTPVSPVTAIEHDHAGTPDTRTITVNGQARPYVDQSIWTGLAGASYLPAAVAPVGRTTGGLPVGVQVIAPYLEDRTAIDVARHIERVIGGYNEPE
ncbi:amidase family protein [Pedococcus sp. 5OH_020]|uniref:amidase family protein n=1 Tax=Pedococcus sp. 5OH_020 TaxID=2989814 RepID=UPI0022E9C5A7|nr:amidase family protein [Pedococcus sp. 5OH_020]